MNARVVVWTVLIVLCMVVAGAAGQLSAATVSPTGEWAVSGTRAELTEAGYQVIDCIEQIGVCRVESPIRVFSLGGPDVEPVTEYSIQDGGGTDPKVRQAAGDVAEAAVPCDRQQWHHATIGSSAAWQAGLQGEGVMVAIVDSGVGPHVDTPVVTGVNLSGEAGGTADVLGHGTHVAGLAAGRASSSCTAGVAPLASIMAVKVIRNGGSALSTTIAEGVIWAADHGARVINMSLGGSEPSFTLQRALQYAASKGAVIVCAAGNGNGTTPAYPAAYPECLSVAATDSADRLASFSGYGSTVDIAAPGVSILSTIPVNAYGVLNGTSMAAPQVSGAAALLAGRGLAAPDVVRTLVTTAAPVGSWQPGIRLDVAAAVRSLGPSPTITPGAPPGPTLPPISPVPTVTVPLPWPLPSGCYSFTDRLGRTGKYTVRPGAFGMYQVTRSCP